jgi:hypothetical protein
MCKHFPWPAGVCQRLSFTSPHPVWELRHNLPEVLGVLTSDQGTDLEGLAQCETRRTRVAGSQRSDSSTALSRRSDINHVTCNVHVLSMLGFKVQGFGGVLGFRVPW